ncbi:MAG: SBBP repeat-containing protein [Deltaproteobacteria bacterium]|nr:SBBP repeat-containing protein [Deltaproteobacteria bacterium]
MREASIRSFGVVVSFGCFAGLSCADGPNVDPGEVDCGSLCRLLDGGTDAGTGAVADSGARADAGAVADAGAGAGTVSVADAGPDSGATPAAVVWKRQFGTLYPDFGRGAAVDSSGNIYVTGYTTFGGLDGNTNVGRSDMFLVKFDGDGGKRWTRQFGTSSDDEGQGVAVDLSGNIYVTGTTNGALDGNTSAGGSDMFLVKYDSDGGKRWTRQLGTAGDDYGYGLVVDLSGNIYVAGTTYGGLDGITSAGGSDMFLVKYDRNGGKVWTRQFGRDDEDRGYGVAVDANGNIYVTGYVSGWPFGDSLLGGKDIFLVKYGGDGARIWNRELGTTLSDRGFGVAVHASGNIYVTGFTEGGIDGNANAGGSDVFLANYDTDGGKRWTRHFGTASNDYGYGVAVDVRGNIYVTGATSGVLDGNTRAGDFDIFVAKFDVDGEQ